MSIDKQEIKEMVAEAFNELLQVPANQLNLGIMFTQVQLQALKLQQQEEERRYARPVVVRAYYEGALRATVAANNEGNFDVTFTELKDGEWVDPLISVDYQGIFSKMILSQGVVDGDVWYITNNASVENNLEKAANFFKKEIDEQA